MGHLHNQQHPTAGGNLTYGDVYARTMYKLEKLRQLDHVLLFHMWECSIRAELEDNETMQQFFNKRSFQPIKSPRDGYFGNDN